MTKRFAAQHRGVPSWSLPFRHPAGTKGLRGEVRASGLFGASRDSPDAPPRARSYHWLSMSRHSRWSRLFATLFALWFAAMVGDSGMLHSCAMHGAAAGHATHPGRDVRAPAARHTALATHDGHADGHRAHHDASPHESKQPTQPAPCTCVGQCCAVTAVAPLPALATLVVPAAVAQERDPLEPQRPAPPATPDLRLPFANGPPTV